MSAANLLCCVADDKGGVGKSLLAAVLAELMAEGKGALTLVEIEARVNFTQQNYVQPAGVTLKAIPLMAENQQANRTEPSLSPLGELWDLIPKESGGAPTRILVDFGASAFQSFLLWGSQHRGLHPFRQAGFQFIFFIPVQAADSECADFFNLNAPGLMKLGKVVLVKNLRAGVDFSLLDAALVDQVQSLTLLYMGSPLMEELQQPARRLTFRQLAAFPNASRRAALDAEACAEHFSEQFQSIRQSLGI
jgi:hypothetical protein